VTLRKIRPSCKLEEEALDLTVWRSRFGRGYGLVVSLRDSGGDGGGGGGGGGGDDEDDDDNDL
jgi:hypothetical protein